MNKRIGIIVVVLVAAVVVAFSSMFTVQQSDKAIVLKLGKIRTNDQGEELVYGPGLHFKTPFADTVKRYDMRLRTLNIKSSRIVTQEQKDVIIDAFVEWRIENISKFYRSTSGSVSRADELLTQVVEGTLRDEVGKRTIQELVNNQRDELVEALKQVVREQAARIGAKVVDARIKSIDLPDTVTHSVYQRMSSNREKDAASIRANGEQLAEEIKAEADARASVIRATAKSKAKQIRAEGERQAARIYGEAYSKDQTFFTFLRSMDAYRNGLVNERNVLVLKPQGEFFRYFNPATIKTEDKQD